jgi:HEAT repeat protein
MATRRALIIAPLYDGQWLPPLLGSGLLVDRLEKCLRERGQYDVKVLNGEVDQIAFREKMEGLFNSAGELLLYFYGHGCEVKPSRGVLACSDASPRNEGVGMDEVRDWAYTREPREVVVFLDCCHAGTILPATVDTLHRVWGSAPPGRVILAACGANEQAWEQQIPNEERSLGAFSYHVLQGLNGEARAYGHSYVRASFVADYVTGKLQDWTQHAHKLETDNGDRLCIVTLGFASESPVPGVSDRTPSPQRTARLYGVPFKPSTLFVGREGEIDYLRSVLTDGTRPVAVSATVEGLGGIGKTELVVQLLCDPVVRSHFDTIVWIDGSGPIPPQWQKLAEELHISSVPADPTVLVARVEQELLHRGKALVVLDNATDWRSVAGLMPPNVSLLVTTRTRDFGGSSFVHREIGILTDEAANDFLLKMVPGLRQDPDLSRLVQTLEGHALAIELAGWNIRYLGLTADKYLQRLSQRQPDPPPVAERTRYGATVEACLSLTWNSLTSDAARALWRHAALFAPVSAHQELLRISFIGTEEVRHLLERRRLYRREYPGEGESEAPLLYDSVAFEEAYADLKALHVLTRIEDTAGERWAMHRLVRDFARVRLRKGDVAAHALSLAEWLRDPNLPLSLEVPHFIAVVLDSARHAAELMDFSGDRFLAREIGVRGLLGGGLPDVGLARAEYFIQYLRDELRDPKALTLILAGVADVNEDVRIQSIKLMEHVGPMPEVVRGLASALADSSTAIRELAARTLAQHGGEQTLSILSATIEGENAPARTAAVRACGFMGERAREALRRALRSPDAAVRQEAALFLCEQGIPDGLDIVLQGMPATGKERERFLHALEMAPDLRAISILVKVLENPTNASVTAVRVLAKLGAEPQAHSALVHALDHPSIAIRHAAAQALVETRRRSDIQTVIHNLQRRLGEGLAIGAGFSPLIRSLSEERKVDVPDDLALYFVRECYALRDKAFYAQHLGKAKAAEAVPDLVKAIVSSYDYDASDAVALLDVLIEIGDESAVPALREAASTARSGAVRAAIMTALLQHGDTGLLATALNASDWKLRLAGVKAAVAAPAEAILPDLIKALSDRHREVRAQALRSLWQLGRPDALPEIIQAALKETDLRILATASSTAVCLACLSGSLNQEAIQQAIAADGRSSEESRRRAAAATLACVVHTCETQSEGGHGCFIHRTLAECAGDLFPILGLLRVPVAVGLSDPKTSRKDELFESAEKAVDQAEKSFPKQGARMFVEMLAPDVPSTVYPHRLAEALVRILAEHDVNLPVDCLAQMVQSEHSRNRVSALVALGLVRGVRAVELIQASLADEASEVRRQAAKSLGWVGKAAPDPAERRLADLAANDSDETVRESARAALQAIEADRAGEAP